MRKESIPLKIIRTRLKDVLYCTGLIFLALCVINFLVPELKPIREEINWFFANYFLAAFYFLILLFSGGLRKREGLHRFFLFLLMFLISAYALNRILPIFDKSAPWFAVTLIICSVNYIAFAFLRAMPVPVRMLMFFLLGLSACCFLYMAIYLIPFAGFGIILSFFFGISLHSFVPLLFLLFTIRLFRRSHAGRRTYKLIFWSGAGTSVLIVLIFALLWKINVVQINNEYTHGDPERNYLPNWIHVAEHITPNPVTAKVLKADLAYATANDWDGFTFFKQPSRNWNEVRKHDPLVLIASMLGGTTKLEEGESAHILESLYDSRYEAEERLWSGDELYTTHVQTTARIWPRLRMGYTEKTVNVKKVGFKSSWRQEAIYIFHLPEGAVVSSLSLWINGKEEKGILTTKAKADSAYKTIVGVESRDPSVVHWQEGNMVSVRVFPIEDNEERQFKIGITAPLSLEHGKLVYRNIYFDGPSTIPTSENVDISFASSPADLHQSGIFHMEKDSRLTADGPYRPDWEVSFKDEGLVDQRFSTNDKTFSVTPYRKESGTADISDVYLDLNNAWSRQEYEGILALLGRKRVWTYVDEKMIQITASNRSAIFDQTTESRFSLFPFFLIPQPATALVVTKGVVNSPSVDDLKGSRFMDELKVWLSNDQHIMLYNLGGELSPYLRTLKECRSFRYDQGDIATLKGLLDEDRFPYSIENDHRIVIESAGMTITETPGTTSSTAPDHLQRLFAYNHIMQAMGPRLLTEGKESDTLVAEAAAAYIVTPLSSLVVLETQADYDRFNIKDSKNSLGNASMKGAVPEPHEWALIVLALLMIAYLKFRPTFFKRTAKI